MLVVIPEGVSLKIYVNNVAAFSKQTSISFNDYGIKYSALNSICDKSLICKNDRFL